MALLSYQSQDIFAPANDNGTPRSPSLQKMQVWGTEIEAVTTATAAASAVFDTRANLYASLAYAANTMAWVVNDTTAAYNGIYRKSGASGSGSWSRVANLPHGLIVASNAGAGGANAIVATSALPISESALVLLNIATTNTSSPVTVAFNGEPALTIKTASGNNVAANALLSGMLVLGVKSGTTFRLLSDQATASIVPAAEAAQVAAEAARDAAIGAVPNVYTPTRTALKALDTGTIQQAYLIESGREGQFIWRSGDYSSQIAADTLEGVFVKANAISASSGAWVRVVEDDVAASWFGAVGDGVTDDTVARDAAAAYVGFGGEIYLPAGKTYLVSNNDNPYGVSFIGPGKLVTAVTGGQRQRNSYAGLTNLHAGREYLERLYAYLALGQGNPLGTFRATIFGDSTATNDYGPVTPTAVLQTAIADKGLPNFILANQAVGGTSWADLDVSAYLGGINALHIYSYGINDASGGSLENRLANLHATMDAKLTAIRAAAGGGIGSLSIVLKGPNATSDSPNGRDERWYEKIRGIYLTMARKHKCAYFDTYGEFLDARDAAGIFMDDAYGDGRAVHPINQFNARIWGAFCDWLLPRSSVARYATNRVSNNGAVSSSLSSGATPSQFLDAISTNRATTENGWPIDGFVVSERNVDGGAVQRLFSYTPGASKVITRTADVAGDTWNPWSGLALPITLANGWTNYGTPWGDAQVSKTADGTCAVSGLVAGGTTTADTVIGTLPTGFRPVKDLIFSVATNGGSSKISVHADGTIKAFSAADGTYTSLSGITYLASN
ncbi:pectate lyase family protein [Affinirhizobium pseudoryzae]|uniref:glycosyl hydrolase family 28-related protein n=1 Tax=Allorhizobium pseudoryzae TaxID=379684 RepID=UPI0019D17FA1|nr:glycosyl hydrolase family 28-related protein [Allorhizobium pseudoryzae]